MAVPTPTPIGDIQRGDLVLVRSTGLNVHGLFVADSVDGDSVRITDPTDASRFVSVNKTADIVAVWTASSISA